jgi:adenylylsulfate kinase
MKKILIMGLPGSGKSTLAAQLKQSLETQTSVEWINADAVRQKYSDWDFSEQGRIRQSMRMRDLSSQSLCNLVICDFVAPLKKMREIFDADYSIWMNTLSQGRFADTNAIFEPPDDFDLKIETWNSAESLKQILLELTPRKWW